MWDGAAGACWALEVFGTFRVCCCVGCLGALGVEPLGLAALLRFLWLLGFFVFGMDTLGLRKIHGCWGVVGWSHLGLLGS